MLPYETCFPTQDAHQFVAEIADSKQLCSPSKISRAWVYCQTQREEFLSYLYIARHFQLGIFFNIVYGGLLMQFWCFSRGNARAPVSQMGKHGYCLWDTSYVLWIHFLMKNIPICFLQALPGDDARLVLAKHDTGTLFGGCCLFHNFSLSLVPCHCDVF